MRWCILQNDGDILLHAIGPKQSDLDWLLDEGLILLAEEVQFHLVVEDCGGGGGWVGIMSKDPQTPLPNTQLHDQEKLRMPV